MKLNGQLTLLKELFQALGLVINWEKSQFEPTQEILFLGFWISTKSMTVSLPREKLRKIMQEAHQLSQRTTLSLQEIAGFVGKTTAARQAIRVAPLFHRHLQALINKVIPFVASKEELQSCYQEIVPLTPEAREELIWWSQQAEKWNSAPLVDVEPNLIIETDASLLGWGAWCNNTRTGGQWSLEEQEMHINALELLAATLATRSFAKDQDHITILIRTDNVTTMAYINHLGGTHSPLLNNLATQLWKWCLERHIFLTAEHLPGVYNTVADEESRTVRDRCDWMVHPDLFVQIQRVLGPLEVDMFASRLTNQLPRFFSWKPDPSSEATDAFTQDWSQFRGYANPPWCLLLATLSKIRRTGSPGCSHMEDPTLVSTNSGNVDRLSTVVATRAMDSDLPCSEGFHNASGSAPTSRMAIVGHQCRAAGLSEAASRLLKASWRSRTKSSYESLFKKWDSWCQERGRNPISGPVADIANFLAELFQQGYKYRSLNSYRSAISSVHEKVDNEEVGKHPLISRVLKGVFNECPPTPKYSDVWDVGQVLDMFQSQGASENLTLQELTIKTVMLFVLTRPCRGADLAALDLRYRSYLPEGVVFKPGHLSKQSRPSHHSVDFFFPAFAQDVCLCPMATLRVYESRTVSFRKDESQNKVFLSFIGKHNPVCSSTVARWLKVCLQKAGVKTSVFQAHSTRAASTTKAAMSGMTVEDIMKTADWTSKGVFQKFYYRPKHSVAYGESVLAASASKSHVDMETEPSEV